MPLRVELMRQGGQTGNSRPLYLQIRDKLIERIRSWQWRPGEPIPTEPKLAEQYGVGHGTARQAVGELENEKLVVRIQGAGTFVFQHTPKNVMSRFFSFFDTAHGRIKPGSRRATVVVAKANAQERRELDLDARARVIRINRVRTRRDRPFMIEAISVPESLFRGLADSEDIPDTLYDLYQRSHRIHVLRTEDHVTAVAADRAAARTLGVRTGMPLLKIESVAFAIGDERVEFRVSLCHLDKAYYLAQHK